MKRLSDYQGEDAIELWTDLIDPLSIIISDKQIEKVIKSGKSKLDIAKEIFKLHKKEAETILLRIDPTPLDGLNIILRLVTILSDIGENEEIRPFFGYAAQVKMDKESSGSAMENIEEKEN